jgi:hypothetical protein
METRARESADPPLGRDGAKFARIANAWPRSAGGCSAALVAYRLAARAVSLDNLPEWDVLNAAGKQEREDQLVELSVA